MESSRKIIDNAKNKEAAAQILTNLEKVSNDVDKVGIDASGNLSELANLHFSIVLGAIKQVAGGIIKEIHPNVSNNIVRFTEIIDEQEKGFAGVKAYSDVTEMRDRIKRIKKVYPDLIAIACNHISYAPEQEHGITSARVA